MALERSRAGFDVEQAIIALKKGSQLLKYGRRGKPKFCPFKLSNDETTLLWYSGKNQRQLKLAQVTKIIPGQRTAIFRRYPRPDKEYQSFSLIYGDRSLDLICKDKEETDVWFVGLKALIAHGNCLKWRLDSRSERSSFGSPRNHFQKCPSPISGSDILQDSADFQQNKFQYDNRVDSSLGNVFSDVILCTGAQTSTYRSEPIGIISVRGDYPNGRVSTSDNNRISVSSAVSSSSHGSCSDDFDALGDVLIWGEVFETGPSGGPRNAGGASVSRNDALLPKSLDSTVLLDVQYIACGARHSVLVTRHGEVYSWGEELGGWLGHGVDGDIPQPKHINSLSGMNFELAACGEYHSCAVTLSGDLYTWGDGVHNSGILGHGSETSHWIPKKVCGQLQGRHVTYVSCGPWHTTVVTSLGQLFTFGDGAFGALGHGDRESTSTPREVEAFSGMHVVRAACGVWHTAAIVEIMDSIDSGALSGKVFTWGDGDKGRLGHSDTETRLIPSCVASLFQPTFCQVACGNDITVALTVTGRVYTMGSNEFGQRGKPEADRKQPTSVAGSISDCYVEEIACGANHVVALTSKSEVYSWGRGANGCLGHGDSDNRCIPTLVEALKDKQVKSIACGTNFTAVICLHKWSNSADQSTCFGCRLPFGFRRKRHNCYNCGLVFCKGCSSRKSLRASLAPTVYKPYRVCDECYTKLTILTVDGKTSLKIKTQTGEVAEKEPGDSNKGQTKPSRLSSVESFKMLSRRAKNVRLPPTSSLFSSLNMTSSSKQQGSSERFSSASVPSSRAASRSASPIALRASPPHSVNSPSITALKTPLAVLDNVNQISESQAQEISTLRSQLDVLTKKSDLLETELYKTSVQLNEARKIVDEERSKNKAAKEILLSLSTQLKGMAGKLPEGFNLDWTSQMADLYGHSFWENAANQTSKSADSNGHSAHRLSCTGKKTSADGGERVEHVEQGVYITVSCSPSGEKFFKRVRFSRKHFTEQQAEQWWDVNKSKLVQKFGILTGDFSASV